MALVGQCPGCGKVLTLRDSGSVPPHIDWSTSQECEGIDTVPTPQWTVA